MTRSRPQPRAEKTPLERLAAKAKREQAQNELAFQLRAANIAHKAECEWDCGSRRRADFMAWRPGSGWMLIVEVDGGLFVNGGHTRGAARERDYERDAEAMLLGFRVLRVSPRHVKTGKAIGWIQKLLEA